MEIYVTCRDLALARLVDADNKLNFPTNLFPSTIGNSNKKFENAKFKFIVAAFFGVCLFIYLFLFFTDKFSWMGMVHKLCNKPLW